MNEKETLQVLGERLRAVRKAKKLSLTEVEEMSSGRFKAVVIGSYERGARAMTVERLVELSDFYQVPVHTFLQGPSDRSTKSEKTPEILDLQKIASRANQLDRYNLIQYQILARYVSHIIHDRQDWNGEVISLRDSDFKNIAICLNRELEEFYTWVKLEEITLSLKS